MKDMWKLKEMLCEELDEFARKGKMNAGDLQTVHMLTDTIKNLDKIELLEDEESEYSGARRKRDARGRYSRDGDRYAYDDGGESYAGNMMRGNYPRHYSRADGKERMMDILEGMRDGVQGPEKQTVERMIEMVHKL